MPRISTFQGIVIKMHYNDHPPPHFHADYGEYKAKISITRLEMIAGWLPPRIMRLVREWGALHRDELVADWWRAQRHEPPVTIEPLP